MPYPSAKRQTLASNSSGTPAASGPRTTYRLLVLVVAMALGTSAALWWTLRQAQDLAQPHQQNDLWYISSVHNELARVSLLARQLRGREASAQDLTDRLDVLYSTLDTSGRGPRVSTQLREALPGTAQSLDELRTLVEQWSEQAIASTPGSSAARPQRATATPQAAVRVAEDISRQSDTLLERLRQAVATVHLFSNQQTDHARQQLHQRFIVLSVVLSGLLGGTALLIAKLVKDARAATAASRRLAQTNRELEDLVARRTRKLEEGRALLGFILDTSQRRTADRGRERPRAFHQPPADRAPGVEGSTEDPVSARPAVRPRHTPALHADPGPIRPGRCHGGADWLPNPVLELTIGPPHRRRGSAGPPAVGL